MNRLRGVIKCLVYLPIHASGFKGLVQILRWVGWFPSRGGTSETIRRILIVQPHNSLGDLALSSDAEPVRLPSPYRLLFWMCTWVLISTFMNNVACILVAASETGVQVWASVVTAIVNLALWLWLVRSMGSVGVILGTVISYSLFLIIPQIWPALRIIRIPRYSTAKSL